MKNIFLISFISLVLSGFTFQSGVDAIVNALKNGNATEVGNYFDVTIDLKLPEKAEMNHIAKSQAETVFKSFYTDNSINGFEVTNRRQIGNTMYLAGKLKNNQKGFNMTIVLHQQGDKAEIISVRIN